MLPDVDDAQGAVAAIATAANSTSGSSPAPRTPGKPPKFFSVRRKPQKHAWVLLLLYGKLP